MSHRARLVRRRFWLLACWWPAGSTASGRSAAARVSAAQDANRDADFVKGAVDSGRKAVVAGKVAMTKASVPEVRAFAERVVKYYTTSTAELMSMAQTPPPPGGRRGQSCSEGRPRDANRRDVRPRLHRAGRHRPRRHRDALRARSRRGQGRAAEAVGRPEAARDPRAPRSSAGARRQAGVECRALEGADGLAGGRAPAGPGVRAAPGHGPRDAAPTVIMTG